MQSGEILRAFLDRCLRLYDVTTDLQARKEISHIANVVTAVHLYRRTKSLRAALVMLPKSGEGLIKERSVRIIWGHLRSLEEDSKLAELSIEAMNAYSRIRSQVVSPQEQDHTK